MQTLTQMSQIRDDDTKETNVLKRNGDELDKVTEKTENDIMTYTTKDKLKDDATKIVKPWEEL
jgi:hypothetical protein